VLTAVARWLPGFFPATLVVARDRAVTLAAPADFDPAVVPRAFAVGGGAMRIPFDGADGSELSILDDRAPTVSPANVVRGFPGAPPPAPAAGLLRALIEALDPDQAWLTDEATAIDDDEVYQRSFTIDEAAVPAALYWMTWLPSGLVTVAGPAAVAALAAVATVEPVAGGLLVRLQDGPTGGDPAWPARRRRAEAALGLAALHARFPRR
jgi:hypothetical protein